MQIHLLLVCLLPLPLRTPKFQELKFVWLTDLENHGQFNYVNQFWNQKKCLIKNLMGGGKRMLINRQLIFWNYLSLFLILGLLKKSSLKVPIIILYLMQTP